MADEPRLSSILAGYYRNLIAEGVDQEVAARITEDAADRAHSGTLYPALDAEEGQHVNA